MRKKVLLLISGILSIFALAGCGGGQHNHSYGEPTFSWDSFNLENSSGEVFVTFKCSSCEDSFVKRATVTKEEKEVSCTEGGYKKYTATYVYNEKTYTDKKEINFSGVLGHSMIKHSPNEATCQRPGNILFYTCANCGKKFSDFDGKNEVDDVSIPQLEHAMTHYDAKGKNCLEDGWVEHYHCSLCELDYKDKEGTTVISNPIIPGGHELVKHNHLDPTCTAPGNIEYYECNVCKNKYSDEACTQLISGDVVIPKLNHSLTEHPAKEPTCLEQGNINYWSCSTCTNLFKDPDGQEITDNVIIPTKKHVWSPSGYCTFCTCRDMMSCVADRTTGTTTPTTDPSMPNQFQKTYLVTGDVGGGEGTNKFFKPEDISKYNKVEFAIRTTADPSKNEKLFLRTWVSATAVLESDGWVIVTCNKDNSNRWTMTSTSGINHEIGEAANLYSLLSFHAPDSICADFYISEVVAYATIPHVHTFGSLNPETNSSCSEHGHIAYYECTSCGAKMNTNGEVVSTVNKPLEPHNYSGDECSVCHKKIHSYADHLQSPSNLSEITDGSQGKADGFNKVYYYNATTGGGTSGGFFKHEGVSGLLPTDSPRITKMEFAVKAFDSNSKLRIRNYDGGAQNSLGACLNWTIVTFTLNDTGDKYICTNTGNDTVFNCPGTSNSLFGIYQLLNDSSMYVTEYLLTFSE